MRDYKFSFSPLDKEWAEIRIVMPYARKHTPCELTGAEAHKGLIKWLLSSAGSVALQLGFDIESMLHEISDAGARALAARPLAQQIVLKHVAEVGPLSPRFIEDNPPGGLASTETRRAVQHLIDRGELALDANLKVTCPKKS